MPLSKLNKSVKNKNPIWQISKIKNYNTDIIYWAFVLEILFVYKRIKMCQVTNVLYAVSYLRLNDAYSVSCFILWTIYFQKYQVKILRQFSEQLNVHYNFFYKKAIYARRLYHFLLTICLLVSSNELL